MKVLQFLKEHNIYVPKFTPSFRYLNGTNLSFGNASYVNYGDRKCFINNELANQLLNILIVNLVLTAFGKVNNQDQLVQDFAELKSQDLAQKFFFADEEQNQEYQEFMAAFKTLLDKEELTAVDLKEFGAEFIETRTHVVHYEVYGEEKSVEENYDSYTNKFAEWFHNFGIQFILSMMVPNTVEYTTLGEFRTRFQSLTADFHERTDLIINSQARLRISDLFESKLATLQNPELMARWHALRSQYVNSSEQDLDDLDYLLEQYFDSLGYESSSFNSLLECFEHEIEIRRYSFELQITELFMMFNRLEHAASYFNLKPEKLRHIFLTQDRPRLSDKQLAWVNLYLRSLSWKDTVPARLYYSYLDENLELEDYLECLHAYWVHNTLNRLYSMYHQPEDGWNLEEIDFFEIYARVEDWEEFVVEFLQNCCDATYTISEVADQDPQKLANFLVFQGSRSRAGSSAYIYDFLKYFELMQNEQLDAKNCDIASLLAEEDKSSLRPYQYRRKRAKCDQLGNFVLIRNISGLFNCKTQDERLAYIYANALENQQLPPAGTAITPEVIQQRSVALLTQILEVADFDKTEHLKLS